MNLFYRSFSIAGICVLSLFSAPELFGQFDNFMKTGFSGRNKDMPTSIKAESMDIDIENDVVTLIGNVDIDDPQMRIKCRKMLLYFVREDSSSKAKENAQQDKNGKKGSSEQEKKTGKRTSDEERDGVTGGRKIDRVVCIGDVEITRPQDSSSVQTSLQKAYAGEAVYYVMESKITLKINPVVISGKNTLKGEFITIYTRTNRIQVLRPDSRFVGGLGAMPGQE